MTLEGLGAHVIQQSVLQISNEISKRSHQSREKVFHALALSESNIDSTKHGNSEQHKTNNGKDVEIQAVFLGNRAKHLISVHIW